jgi:hypothetical protein
LLTWKRDASFAAAVPQARRARLPPQQALPDRPDQHAEPPPPGLGAAAEERGRGHDFSWLDFNLAGWFRHGNKVAGALTIPLSQPKQFENILKALLHLFSFLLKILQITTYPFRCI